MRDSDSRVIFEPMRLLFVILPTACVASGTVAAVWSGSDIKLFYLALSLHGEKCCLKYCDSGVTDHWSFGL